MKLFQAVRYFSTSFNTPYKTGESSLYFYTSGKDNLNIRKTFIQGKDDGTAWCKLELDIWSCPYVGM